MMMIRSLARLAWRDVISTPGRAAIAVFGISLGIAILSVTVGVGLGARDFLLGEVVQQLPLDTVEAVPRSLDLGIIQTSNFLGSTPMNDQTLERLRDLDAVQEVFPKLELSLPMGARGGSRLVGRRLYTDLFMTALPAELLGPKSVGDPARDSGLVPVFVSPQLLDIFNASVAPALSLPRLSENALQGFEFELVMGRSLMLGGKGAKTEGRLKGRVVGVSAYAKRLGASVSLDTARRLWADYSSDPKLPPYKSFLVRARSPADLPAVVEAIRALGLSIDESAAQTGDLILAATALASLVGFLILVLAAFQVAHNFLTVLAERRREFAILRAVGAWSRDLLGLVLLQAAGLGLLGGLVGIGVGHGLGAGINALLRVFPYFPWKPESLVQLSWSLDAAMLAAAVLAAVGGALWPAWRAARAPVAQALSQ